MTQNDPSPTTDITVRERRTSSGPQLAARLVVASGTTASRIIPIDREIVIGRGPDVDVLLADSGVSRRHAMIRPNAHQEYVLRDLGSRNGTLVNGEPITERTLEIGDKLEFGHRTIMLFTFHEELEDRLLQSQRLESMGQLAGGVAHDFNNILAAILSNVHFLEAEFGGSSRDLDECVQEIRDAANRASELTAQLLGFARRGKLTITDLSVSQLVDEVVSLCRRTFDRSIEIETDISRDLFVRGDPSQLHQVLLNLCLNARDAMPRGGHLSISATVVDSVELGGFPPLDVGEYVALRVQDTGTGIPANIRDRIFEPFFTTKTERAGTGLGLATAYGILSNHAGRIDVESELGKGSTFVVLVPISRREDEPQPEPTSARLAAPSPPLTILVIDDDDLVRSSSARLLGALGHSVVVANGGEEGVRLYERLRDSIDVVLLDLVMPGMDGAETFAHLRRLDPEVRIVLTTGYHEDERVLETLEKGADGFLPKPFNSDLVRVTLNLAFAQN